MKNKVKISFICIPLQNLALLSNRCGFCGVMNGFVVRLSSILENDGVGVGLWIGVGGGLFSATVVVAMAHEPTPLVNVVFHLGILFTGCKPRLI